MSQIPTLGRIVIYTLTGRDAKKINGRRGDARAHMQKHKQRKNGVMVHVGNAVSAGEFFPMIITRVWGPDATSAVNGQVMLDGGDLFWVSSVQVGKEGEAGSFSWPAIRSAAALAFDDKLASGTAGTDVSKATPDPAAPSTKSTAPAPFVPRDVRNHDAPKT